MKHLLITTLLLFSSLNSVFSAQNGTKPHQEYPTYYAHVNNLNLAYQDFGNQEDDAVLLIMGLGGQLIHWDDDFVLTLVEQGYRVIRFDNRDSGWSSKLYKQGTPGWTTYVRYKLDLPLKAPYKLSDMAADSIALLDYLNIQQAHVAGLSMGGMIAQIMASQYPDRVTTLTSIMSTSGAKDLPKGKFKPNLEDQSDFTREQTIQANLEFAEQIDGTAAELTKEQWISRLSRSYDRANYKDGIARQMWAIGDSGDRVEQLKTIKQPSLIIHGSEDPLIPHQAGEHTANLIPNSKFVLLDGMGHFIDEANEPKIINQMLSLFTQSKESLSVSSLLLTK